MTHIPPASDTFLREAHARARIAHHIITGFAREIPALSEPWQQIDNSISDIPALIAEITRQVSTLAACRLSRANLAAAGLATLAAWHDGEPDPLSYLRDELAAQGFERRPA